MAKRSGNNITGENLIFANTVVNANPYRQSLTSPTGDLPPGGNDGNVRLRDAGDSAIVWSKASPPDQGRFRPLLRTLSHRLVVRGIAKCFNRKVVYCSIGSPVHPLLFIPVRSVAI